MPTNQNAYNSRVTDEALEKKFRDTFVSQGGAELVDDLYASGVIVPIVDFTAASQGSELRSDLQTAWDFATGHNTVSNTGVNIITTPGFWKVDLNLVGFSVVSTAMTANMAINDGIGFKVIWQYNAAVSGTGNQGGVAVEDSFVVFLRSGDFLRVYSSSAQMQIDVWYRQIADVYGNLVNPLGYTSS